MRPEVRISTQVPAVWADKLNEMAGKRSRYGRRTKAGMLRAGLRLYLQHQVDTEEEWSALELGPLEKPLAPRARAIDVDAVEIPLDAELG